LERKSKFSALGRLFKPWKWKRKKKSDKFEAASRCKYGAHCAGYQGQTAIFGVAVSDYLWRRGIGKDIVRGWAWPTLKYFM